MTLREELAELAHEMWAGWMSYLFEKCVHQPDGSIVIPANYADHWKRQANLPYRDLTPSEQESDRREADRILERLRIYARSLLF